MNEALVASLKAKHGDDLVRVKTAEHEFAAKIPDRRVWHRFKDMAADKNRRRAAFEWLAKECVVHPEPEAFDALLNKRPVLAETVASKLIEFAGGEEDVEAGEL